MVVRTPSARERKLVEEGAKGVAGRWLGDAETAAKEGARMRSAVKRYSGKEEQAGPEPSPQAEARRRSTRAEQAAAGMMGPPPTTFDEKAIKSWLDKMPAEDLAKLAKLTAIAKAGKEENRPAWNKVDRGIAQRGLQVVVNGGTVQIVNEAQSDTQASYGSDRFRARDKSGGLARHLSRFKDFING